MLVVAYSGLVDISAVEDEEEELVHWVWDCDFESLSNVEGVAEKNQLNQLNQFSDNHLLKYKLQKTLFNFYKMTATLPQMNHLLTQQMYRGRRQPSRICRNNSKKRNFIKSFGGGGSRCK